MFKKLITMFTAKPAIQNTALHSEHNARILAEFSVPKKNTWKDAKQALAMKSLKMLQDVARVGDCQKDLLTALEGVKFIKVTAHNKEERKGFVKVYVDGNELENGIKHKHDFASLFERTFGYRPFVVIAQAK